MNGDDARLFATGLVLIIILVALQYFLLGKPL